MEKPSDTTDYRYIYLPSGDYIQIKFDVEGVVYDRFDEDDEHQESYGYDFYSDIPNLNTQNGPSLDNLFLGTTPKDINF